jgi:acetyl esterase/lipase
MNVRESICSIVCLISLLGGAPLVGADADPKVILLWPNGASGSEGKSSAESVRITPEGEHVVSSVHQPSMTAHLPPQGNTTGAAVIIAPGGGHRELWMADIKRAIRVVRRHASEWGVRPDRIGVMGFSAGGEVAAWTTVSVFATELARPVSGWIDS